MKLATFARRGYVDSPTPLVCLPRFSKAIGGNVKVYIKRDDLLPGCAGGNKTRKLDFLIADALAKGADTIVTCGAVQSNHCRLSIAWALREGLDCHLVLQESATGKYRPEASGNNLLFQLLGATISVVPEDASVPEAMEELASRLRAEGKKPYLIPAGGSSPLGALGYAACARELLEQLFQQGLDVKAIVAASGSGGTQAGLLLGLCSCEADIPVMGINIMRAREQQETMVLALAHEAAALAGLRREIAPSSVICLDDYLGEGYTLPTDGMIEAVTLLARTEAILLDPVYSGKALAGLIDLARQKAFPEGSDILFLHTGGAPALYEHKNLFV